MGRLLLVLASWYGVIMHHTLAIRVKEYICVLHHFLLK
jgi:hypothetical protein